MKFIDFLHYIIRNLDLDYESQFYMYGYIDALKLCDDSVTVREFGNPFFIKLYDLLIKPGRLCSYDDNIQNPCPVGDKTDTINLHRDDEE